MKYKINQFIKLGIISLLAIIPSFSLAATLSLTAATQSIKVNDIFTVYINLDTENVDIEGVDVYYLKYEKNKLEVQDDSSSSGIQISPGSLMSNTLINSVDTTSDDTYGKISFSQITNGGQSYRGSGRLATIRFKALASGTASATFDFTAGATNDSNVASNGTDVLSSVTNRSYSISANTVIGGGGYVPDAVDPIYPDTNQPSTTTKTKQTTKQITPTKIKLSVINKFLKLGNRGVDVTALQSFLETKSYLKIPAGIAKGYFGALTKSALIKYQKDNKIPGTGYFGPLTKAKANSEIKILNSN